MSAVTGNEELIGRRLGRYLVASSLGVGGMAEVFRARDERLSREVAIKVVLPVFGSEPELLRRFLREARTVASLEHPNILPIYDFGERDGVPYLVMPLIAGGTLADRLEGGPLEPPRVAGWVRELARALDAAHAAGVLHRDVKPGNVLVGRDDHLFLADFGIARLCDATRLTRTGAMVGTPIYMAPEVASGEPARAASDLYSLAVMSYEMLAGKPPFEGDNALSVLHQHATRPVPPITGHSAHLPAGVDRVLELGLAKQPAARPASCRSFAELLAEQLLGVAAEALPPAAGTPADESLPTIEMTSVAETVAPAAPGGARRRLWPWALAGLAVLVASAGLLMLLARGGRHDRTEDVSVRRVRPDALPEAPVAEDPAAAPAGARAPEHVAKRPLAGEHDARRRVRALIQRLGGDHQAILNHAVPLYRQLDDGDTEARGALALAIGDASLALGRGQDALEWYQRAFDLGDPFRAPAAMRGVEAARRLRRPELAAELLRRACEAGVQPACRRLERMSRRPRNRE